MIGFGFSLWCILVCVKSTRLDNKSKRVAQENKKKNQHRSTSESKRKSKSNSTNTTTQTNMLSYLRNAKNRWPRKNNGGQSKPGKRFYFYTKKWQQLGESMTGARISNVTHECQIRDSFFLLCVMCKLFHFCLEQEPWSDTGDTRLARLTRGRHPAIITVSNASASFLRKRNVKQKKKLT